MLKWVQVRQCFDAALLQAEVALLEEKWWKQHYNTDHYSGGWTVIPLRAVSGSADNIISVGAAASADGYCDTPLLQHCAAIRSVLEFFACEKTAVRLMKLHAGAVIREHRDQGLNVEEGEARFHIPLVTNEQVAFLLDGERIDMKEGECWYLNLSLKHGVHNGGKTDRIHLVIDCVVNEWVKDLLADHIVMQKSMAEENKKGHRKEDTLKIIAELRLSGLAVAHALADQMEKEI